MRAEQKPMTVGDSPIPKGLRSKAQGCEERATLGNRNERPQPQRGCVAFLPPNHNPVVVEMPRLATQGCSFLATLGFGSESLWDSPANFRNIFRIKS